MARIAVIGWGSLLWDLDDLAPHVTGDWKVADGPVLPFEFVRISPKRKQALVVVIDEDHGVDCATSYIESRRTDLHEAVEDLARRERAQTEHIGFTDRSGTLSQTRHHFVGQTVMNWLGDSGFDGAVWTDLSGNYRDILGTEFNIPGAIDYLKTLKDEALTEAKRYIESAPANVETPLRAALRNDSWWQTIKY